MRRVVLYAFIRTGASEEACDQALLRTGESLRFVERVRHHIPPLAPLAQTREGGAGRCSNHAVSCALVLVADNATPHMYRVRTQGVDHEVAF